MSDTSILKTQIIKFTMYRGSLKREESFECKSTTSGRDGSTYDLLEFNKLVPDPADFLPNGIDLFKNIKNTRKGKLLANPTIFKKIFIASLLFAVFVVISKILCISYSYWLNPTQNDNDKYNVLIQKNYKNEWDNIYENVRKIQQQTEKNKIELQTALNYQRKLKTKIEDLRAETLSILARKFEQVYDKIDDAFTLYDADKIGKTDYALESAGGSILSTPNTHPYPSNRYVNFFGVKVASLSDPLNVIRPGTFPGQCFAFRGQKARIIIHLVRPIIVDSVTMDYPHPKLLIDTASAPKNFKVYGLEINPNVTKNELGHFTFIPNSKKTTVTFFINSTYDFFYEYVELKILNNHGHPNYTCVYRFRVHGKEKK